MVYIAFTAAVFLLGLNIYQVLKSRDERKQIRYITGELSRVTKDASHEKLLVLTDHPDFRQLLIVLNGLIETNHRNAAAFQRTEHSIRKMLSNISHDLKTPLTVIMGYTEILSTGPEMDDKRKQELAQRIHSKAKEVVQFLNEFFQLAKLESGDQLLPLTRLDIHELCRRSMLNFYEAAIKQGFEAEIEIPEEPCYVKGNEEGIGRILNNLLTNGLHHGREGGVIGIRIRKTEEKVQIDVWDKGSGFKEEDKERIFERLYTLENSRNKTYQQGSGLGLTIARRLAEQMEGSLTAESTPGVRTVFTLTLKHFDY